MAPYHQAKGNEGLAKIGFAGRVFGDIRVLEWQIENKHGVNLGKYGVLMATILLTGAPMKSRF